MTCSVDFCVAIPNSLTHYCCLSVSFRTGRGAGLSQTETPYSTLMNEGYVSLSKTLTFCDTTPGFPSKEVVQKFHIDDMSLSKSG